MNIELNKEAGELMKTQTEMKLEMKNSINLFKKSMDSFNKKMDLKEDRISGPEDK